jgi:aminoglycoside 6-adenylyltransferase
VPSDEPPAPQPPTQNQFLNLVNDFWYHAVWVAKKLRRGELWTAKQCCDSYMKRALLTMIEWHASAASGWSADTWHNGRFLEQWADPRAVDGLRDAFAHYDAADVRRALLASMDLFRWLATETAGRLGYPYPTSADEHVTALVRSYLSEQR